MPNDNFFLMKTTVVSQESRNSNVIFIWQFYFGNSFIQMS